MRPSISATLLTGATLVALLAGCGDADGSGSASPSEPGSTSPSEPGTGPTTTTGSAGEAPDAIADRTWVVTGIITVAGAQPVPPDVEATLTFGTDGTLEVEGGCNTGSGDASFDGDTVSVSVAVTEMACTDEDRMNVEQAVLAVLGSPMNWNVSGDTLTLIPTDVSDSGLQLRDTTAPPDTTPPDTTGEAAPTSDRSALLAAIAANRVFTDNSFGGGDDVFDAIGIVDALATIDDDGDFARVRPNSPSLSPEEREAIEAALSPLPVRWIEPAERDDVIDRIMKGTARIGALITLAEPEIDGASATAHSELYCGGLCAIGGAHELERQPDGTWTVTGTFGPQWIS